ncbi:GDSL-type esterase/lipase family protein [Virgibacillus ndiopensis]|uniref:GDSL-type esterase/lipase family protein n=1 Tax=Virgibacillus ndiopensis TaxID=2004408 RepID=UPI000C070690|nr:GDSL-type esterase/lipase family protein [Virgibacillus ndiopensis]
MKKIFKLLAFILIAILPFSTTAFANKDNSIKSLVALGDSIPYGYNLSKNNNSPSRFSYPYLIGNDANLHVKDLGIPGWRTTELLEALKTDQKFRQAVKHADYITLSIGSNDLLQALKAAQASSGGDPGLFMPLLQSEIQKRNIFGNIGEIILEIRTLTEAPIAVYNVYNPFQTDDPLHLVGSNILPIVNEGFDQLLINFTNVVIADAFTAFGEDQATYVIPGDIHPTINGQIKLAEIGLDAFGLH